MSNFPEFFRYGYRVKKELGSNRAGGRVTYLAVDLTTLQSVVIKQFQFAKSTSRWVDYDAYDREIEVLRGLNHPGIPRYLNSFHTADGFCMVQEYKNALSLAVSSHLSLDEIKRVAISILEILVYLQHQHPPIIHRDIKPENILVDEYLNVYLIDFGFARIGNGEVGVSSVVKGTLGFMPPEQLFNRQLTEASDLYGLGITIICLLTGTRSAEIGNLIDISYQISFEHLVSSLSRHWVNWLHQMVEPKLKDRYPNAVAALRAIPDTAICSPEVRFSHAKVELVASRLGEKLTQTIRINNSTPEIELQGVWEIAPHPHDPPVSGFHSWISLHPLTIQTNCSDCEITVDTSKLMAGKTYARQILLCTNASAEVYSLEVQVQTAPIPTKTEQLPYTVLSLLFLFALVVNWLLTLILIVVGDVAIGGFGASAGVAIGLEIAAWMLATAGASTGASAGAIAGVAIGLMTLTMAWSGIVASPETSAVTGIVLGLMGGGVIGVSTGTVAEKLVDRRINRTFAITVSLLVAASGSSLGLGFTLGFFNPFVTQVVLATSLALAAVLVYLPLKQIRLTNTHRRAERRLIKP